MKKLTGNILMVGNFSSSTGYAWEMISSCFAAIGHEFSVYGNQAYVCFPTVDTVPEYLLSAEIIVEEFDFPGSKCSDIYWFVKKRKIRWIYLIDHPSYSLRYFILRLAGVSKIIVHDHASGARARPKFVKMSLKKLLNHNKLLSADYIIAISNFVKKRIIVISCVPPAKVRTILNGVNPKFFTNGQRQDAFRLFKIDRSHKIIFCACRANFYKGIDILIRIADELINIRGFTDLCFLYCGDGPDFHTLQAMIDDFELRSFFRCPGQVEDISSFLSQVYVSVVPSVWEEGFGMTVIEAMAAQLPVVASRVGGMAEIMTDTVDGYYFEPKDFLKASDIIEHLLLNKHIRYETGLRAAQNVIKKYSRDVQHQNLINFFKTIS